MFSALKKLVTNEQGDTRPSIPTGMQTMGISLQRKFAKGVQYNMKVIIKGDRNTGKSTLFYRLQGEKFREDYSPTDEIQVASIHWNYKATDDVVKVEVWDVVDKGKPRKRDRTTLKIENNEMEVEENENPCLDASFLNVYKGTNGVVMMLDISKKWTWKYVQLELPKVPHHIPVLVMANFRDLDENRAVYFEEIEYFIKELDRPPGSAYIRVAESSMKNGFGLKYLHSFFNIPFLQLQRETLLQQLQRNQLETDATLEELDARVESEDQDYDMYLASLSQKQREKPKGSSLNVPNGQTPRRYSDTSSNPSSASATPARVSPAHTPGQLTPSSTPPTNHRQQPPQPQAQQSQKAPPPASQSEDSQSLGNRFSKWFTPSESKVKQGTRVEDEKPAVIEAPAEILHSTQQPPAKISNVDEFVPDEGLDRGFFDETDSAATAAPAVKKTRMFSFGRKAKPKPTPPPPVITPVAPVTEDSDSDGANPMVAGFQEELDSEDEAVAGAPLTSPDIEEPESPQSFDQFSRRPPKWNKESSSEEEDDRPAIALDDDLEVDAETPPGKSMSACQNTGWSLGITSSSPPPTNLSTEPNLVLTSSTGLADRAGGNKVKTFSSSSSSSTLSESRTAQSGVAMCASAIPTASFHELDSSADEEEEKLKMEIKVLEDCEDVSDDEPKKRDTGTCGGRVESEKVAGRREDDSDEKVQPQTETALTPSLDGASPTTLGLTLQLEDLNFLESVTSKPAKKAISRNLSRASDEFDMLVSVAQDEDISESETNTSTSTSSSAKKKKHRTKDRDKDEEKSHKKHKHKKHRDREERHSKKESSHDGEEEKKRKKKKSSSSSSIGSSSKKRSSEEKGQKREDGRGGGGGGCVGGEMDDSAALEAFLEGF